jgi:EAL domain-containing protein (putative c-di-GMP-specific phosphodiesterase class I)
VGLPWTISGPDTGTLKYVKHLPIDFIKIDAEFVRELTTSATDEQLVKTIVTIAREFGKKTIAEGVEDGETLGRLRELGVDHAQGFFLGRPGRISRTAGFQPVA